jgi:signal peptidase I
VLILDWQRACPYLRRRPSVVIQFHTSMKLDYIFTMIPESEYETLGMQSVLIPATPPSVSRRNSARTHPEVVRYNRIRRCQQIAIIATTLLLSTAIYFVISRCFLQSFKVVGISMVPTLDDKSFYLLNRWAFHEGKPKRGDVVVIQDPSDHGFAVKRVIALPGEAVHLQYGKVFVNGRRLDEDYLLPHTLTFTYSRAKEQLITCGKDQYFVLGDNRPVSIDSRSYGPVSLQNILGKVILHPSLASTGLQASNRSQTSTHGRLSSL